VVLHDGLGLGGGFLVDLGQRTVAVVLAPLEGLGVGQAGLGHVAVVEIGRSLALALAFVASASFAFVGFAGFVAYVSATALALAALALSGPPKQSHGDETALYLLNVELNSFVLLEWRSRLELRLVDVNRCNVLADG